MKKIVTLCLSIFILTACSSKKVTEEVQLIHSEINTLQGAVLENSIRLDKLEQSLNPKEIVIPEKEVVYGGAEENGDDLPLITMPDDPTAEEDVPVAPTAAEEHALITPTIETAEVVPPVTPETVQPTTPELPVEPSVESKPVQQVKTIAGLTEEEAYQASLNLYRTRRYSDSINAFNTFMQTYPSSKFSSNALYWKGESYYAKENFSEAILTFKDILARFPSSSKSADALLKIALAYNKLGDEQNSKLHTTVLYEDWPSSEAAKKAKQLNL